MKRRPWVIKPSLVAAILAALLLYSAVAELAGSGLLGPRMPGKGVVAHRLWECLLLWCFACMAVGWIQYARKRRPPRNATSWPLVIITMAMAVWPSLAAAWEMYADYLERVKTPRPLPWDWRDWLLAGAFVGLPLLLGLIVSAVLALQGGVWRQSTTPGFCPVCNYDLTGNVSGTCPECGTPIVTNRNIPRWFFARRYRWLPELSLFPDARARYEAWQQARRQYQRRAWAWISGAVVILLALSFVLPVVERLGPYRWPVFGLLACLALADAWNTRRIMRRSLRVELQRAGKCPKCGAALVAERCPRCVERSPSEQG